MRKQPVDTAVSLFGQEFAYPFFAGPVGAVKLHYGEKYTDQQYNEVLLNGCKEGGIVAFTGDGTDARVMQEATAAVRKLGGFGIPTVKPWDMDTIRDKMELVKQSGAFAVAMDIDAAGLPFLQNLTPPAGSKSVEQLKEIVKIAEIPFVLKGIMTVRGAEKSAGGRCTGDCSVQSRGKSAGSVPFHSRGSAGYRKSGGRTDEGVCRRRNPDRNGCL